MRTTDPNQALRNQAVSSILSAHKGTFRPVRSELISGVQVVVLIIGVGVTGLA